MSKVEIDIAKLEKLSMLRVPADQRAKITSQLEGIIDFIGQLNEVDTTGVKPMASTVALASTPVREDVPNPEIDRDALQAGAPAKEHGFFVVPRVVGES